MKIERGLLEASAHNEEINVRGVGALFKLNANSLFERDYDIREPVLGVIINNKYSVCHEFELKSGEKFFGYVLANGFGSNAIRVQIITDFDMQKHYPYNQDKDYNLGNELILKKENIVGFFSENETA